MYVVLMIIAKLKGQDSVDVSGSIAVAIISYVIAYVDVSVYILLLALLSLLVLVSVTCSMNVNASVNVNSNINDNAYTNTTSTDISVTCSMTVNDNMVILGLMLIQILVPTTTPMRIPKPATINRAPSGPPTRPGHELPGVRSHALRSRGRASGPRASPSGRVSRSLQAPDAIHVPRASRIAERGGGGGGAAAGEEVPDGRLAVLSLAGNELGCDVM